MNFSQKAFIYLLVCALLLNSMGIPSHANNTSVGYWRLIEIRTVESEYFNPAPSDYRVRSIEFKEGATATLNLGEVSTINVVTTEEKNGSAGKYQAYLKWTHPASTLLPGKNYNLLLVGKQEDNTTDLMLGTSITCSHQLLSPEGIYQPALAVIENASLELMNKEYGEDGISQEKSIVFMPRLPDTKKEYRYIFRVEAKNVKAYQRYDYIYQWINETLPELAEIRVFIDGKLLISDVPGMIIEGRTLLPLRSILEALGATIGWDGITRTITATKDETALILVVGNKEVLLNGNKQTIDVPPLIINNRTLVPARFLAESFGKTVEWDGTARTVSIRSDL